MEKSSQIAWKIVPLRHFFPLKVVPLFEILLYPICLTIHGADPLGLFRSKEQVGLIAESAVLELLQTILNCGVSCAVWVWCGDEAKCGKQYQECWLKHVVSPFSRTPQG
jgi:hypothetical protein